MTEITYLSEIFPFQNNHPNVIGFKLTSEVSREIGNRLSFHLSCQFSELEICWEDGIFWVLGMQDREMPDTKIWREALDDIQAKQESFRQFHWSFQWIRQPKISPQVLGKLAARILKKTNLISHPTVASQGNSEVRREVEVWSETIELEDGIFPAVTLTFNSQIVCRQTLSEFYDNHPYRQDPKQLLLGLKVQDLETGSIATIVDLAGTVGEHRQKLLANATGATSRFALENAPDDQPLVAIQFRNNSTQFHYAMAALGLCITAETAKTFGVDYGRLLKKTKIENSERQERLQFSKKEAVKTLFPYGFEFKKKSFNSRQYPDYFWQLESSLKDIPLQFGKGKKLPKDQLLKGLKQGGVYKRHHHYQNSSRKIRIAAFKLCNLSVNSFLEQVQIRLKEYGFDNEIVSRISLTIDNKSPEKIRVEIEEKLQEILAFPTDVVLVFLPRSDRSADDEDSETNLYQKIYSSLLNRQVASQFIQEDTLEQVQTRFILNQIIPGILAKLGNLPFVLAEPLTIADYFIGLDVSRFPRKNLPGTVNACASIRLYGQRGEFSRYRLEGEFIEGEEIPQGMLEKILPSKDLKGKTVLIYRDGRFVGREVDNLLAWAKAIQAQFILVECKKTRVPRLYSLSQGQLLSPTQGLGLRLSSREGLLVTTKISAKVGLPRPIRLIIHEQGYSACLKEVMEVTLKLTLLHHGALQSPRLPIPLYGADKMAKLRLNGIFPNGFEGDRQFWL